MLLEERCYVVYGKGFDPFKIKGYSFHLILVPGRIIRIANRRDVVEIEFGQITHRFDLSKCKTNKSSCVGPVQAWALI